jgi:hypothetical protein
MQPTTNTYINNNKQPTKQPSDDDTNTVSCVHLTTPPPHHNRQPYYYMGNYDLCTTFPDAHFCIVKVIAAGQPIGQLAQCVSKECTGSDLTEKFNDLLTGVFQILGLVSQLTANAPPPARGEEDDEIDDRFTWPTFPGFPNGTDFNGSFPGFPGFPGFPFPFPVPGGQGGSSENGTINGTTAVPPAGGPPPLQIVVSCGDETKLEMDAAGYIWAIVAAIAVALVVLGSLYDKLYLVSETRNGNTVTFERRASTSKMDVAALLFSGFYNTERLTASIPGDFNSLNGLRVVSMMWIIFGHTMLTSFFPAVYNVSAVQHFLQTPSFALVKGAEYAVDTFFLLSGFLATWGVFKSLSGRALTVKSYLMMVLSRWLRLTPSYAFVLFGYWKLIPLIEGGPFW